MPEADHSGGWLTGLLLGFLAAGVLALLWRRGVIDPRRMDARDVSAVPGWVWLLAAMALVLAQVLGATVGAAVGGDVPGPGLRQQGIMQLCGLGVPAVVGAAVVALLARRAPDGGNAAGLRARGRDIPVGVVCLLLAAPVVMMAGFAASLAYEAVTGDEPDPIAHEALRQIIEHRDNPWTWVLIGGAVVLAPVVEELVFRVFLGGALLAALGRAWVAIPVTAAVFALIHRAGSTPVPWHATAVLWVLGLALGVAYERTRRLGVPILMHSLFNAANIVLALSMKSV